MKAAPRSPDGRAGRSQMDCGPGPAAAACKESLPVLNTRIICPGRMDCETWFFVVVLFCFVLSISVKMYKHVFLKIDVSLREGSWYYYHPESRSLDFWHIRIA